MNCKFTIS